MSTMKRKSEEDHIARKRLKESIVKRKREEEYSSNKRFRETNPMHEKEQRIMQMEHIIESLLTKIKSLEYMLMNERQGALYNNHIIAY